MLMNPVAVTFRAAIPDDAAPLAAFAERTFREAFGPDNTPENMDLYCSGAYTVAQLRSELKDPTRHVVLAVRGGDLVAYAQLCAGRAPDCVTGPDPIEIVRFYVDARWHGHGLATSLMVQTIAAAERRGARTVHLAVWERNARAIAFYRRLGFAKVGSKPFILGTDPQTDEIMVRPVWF